MRMDWAIAFTSSDAIDRESDVNAHYVWRMHARDTGIGGNAIDQRLRRACGHTVSPVARTGCGQNLTLGGSP